MGGGELGGILPLAAFMATPPSQIGGYPDIKIETTVYCYVIS